MFPFDDVIMQSTLNMLGVSADAAERSSEFQNDENFNSRPRGFDVLFFMW